MKEIKQKSNAWQKKIVVVEQFYYTSLMIITLGPTQVKCRLLSYSIFIEWISSIFWEMLEFKLPHFPKFILKSAVT